MDNTEGVLRRAPLFDGLDDEGARGLRRQMAEVKLSRGEHLFLEGDDFRAKLLALLPLATGKRASQLGVALHFWMALVGCFIYVTALSVGGTIQGLDWMHGLPFIQSVIDMQSYYVWRGVGGALMFLSHIVFAWNVWRICYGPGAVASPLESLRAEEALA